MPISSGDLIMNRTTRYPSCMGSKRLPVRTDATTGTMECGYCGKRYKASPTGLLPEHGRVVHDPVENV